MGCIDMTDPLSLGFIGRNGAYPANQAGRHAELVVAIGARFDDRSALVLAARLFVEFPRDQAHPRRCRPRRTRSQLCADLGIVADARTFLRQVLGELERRNPPATGRLQAWLADIAKWRQECPSRPA
jgi:acetolactate synthase-1/2/3 large subunit